MVSYILPTGGGGRVDRVMMVCVRGVKGIHVSPLTGYPAGEREEVTFSILEKTILSYRGEKKPLLKEKKLYGYFINPRFIKNIGELSVEDTTHIREGKGCLSIFGNSKSKIVHEKVYFSG